MIKCSISTHELAEEKGNHFGVYESHWDEVKEINKIFNSKRMQKRIDNETYKYLTVVHFKDHIRFFIKSKCGTPMYFACYSPLEDTLHVFSNKVCSLAHHNELYGLSKADIIRDLT